MERRERDQLVAPGFAADPAPPPPSEAHPASTTASARLTRRVAISRWTLAFSDRDLEALYQVEFARLVLTSDRLAFAASALMFVIVKVQQYLLTGQALILSRCAGGCRLGVVGMWARVCV